VKRTTKYLIVTDVIALYGVHYVFHFKLSTANISLAVIDARDEL